MRTNLIFHFHCSECGNILNICYPKDAAKAIREDPQDMCEGCNIKVSTGAECMYPPVISVEPCKYCIDKYTSPAKKLIEAMRQIGTI